MAPRLSGRGAPRRLRRRGATRAAEMEGLRGPRETRLSAGIAQSPGLQRRHYAPAAIVRLASRPELESVAARVPGPVGVLLRGDTPAPQGVALARLPEDAPGFARGLYAALRDLEDAGCKAL